MSARWTSCKRVELQAQQLQQTANKLDNQAREALGHGREDLAREALARRAAIRSQAAELKQQHEQLSAEEAKLVDASRRLEAKIQVASMQARSGAVDELMASGALEDLSGSSDPLQAELDRISASTGVDAELDEMKRELQSGERAALESSEEEEKS